MAIIYDSETRLRERAVECLEDDFKHRAIENAQEVFYAKRKALVDAMPEWEDVRSAGEAIRNHVTQNMDYYVAQFVKNTIKRGNKVHFAQTADDAICEILDIFEEHNAASCVKSKSMMTEEIGLNEILEEATIKVVETDCAENILQQAGSRPSHIVVPALHFDREAIAKIYHDRCGYDGTTVPEDITHFIRSLLRNEFLSADVGIRGCNFGVASTGSTTLVTNEGNGRMVDSCPETQIVVLGIDRIVPDLDSLDVMMALLPRSAVGAKITGYFSVDTGPRRDDEVDGPKNVHIVLVDNGRSSILGGEFDDMLRCIRCGACLNICPVYRHITGHGYGSIYPGPMGVVLTTCLEGYDAAGPLPYACTLCGACDEHCPMKIPLHELIRKHRINKVKLGKVDPREVPLMRGAGVVLSNAAIYRAGIGVGKYGMKALAFGEPALTKSSAWMPVLKGWTISRDLDCLASKPFREWFQEHGVASTVAYTTVPAAEAEAEAGAVASVEEAPVEPAPAADTSATAKEGE